MTRVATQHAPAPSNFCTDNEILSEIAEVLPEVGDVRYDSVVVDRIRSQITCRLEDGRQLRVTCVFV